MYLSIADARVLYLKNDGTIWHETAIVEHTPFCPHESIECIYVMYISKSKSVSKSLFGCKSWYELLTHGR